MFGMTHRMASALLLSGVLCNFGAQADVSYSKVGVWSVVYREAGNLSGCLAVAQFPDQTIFQMALIQVGTNKTWAIFISKMECLDREKERDSIVACD
jgi:hypothetical protein